ncbi:hypothetical protein Lal_00015806 [Lupinus albus]|nr:hypothetical protein Lal_00015806 [Lupinus albus]
MNGQEHSKNLLQRISFKAKISHSRSQEERIDHEEYDSNIDEETISVLVNKFRKSLRKKGGFRKFHKENEKDSIKKSKYPKDKTTCHECGKVCHMRYTCPTYLKRVDCNNMEDSQDIQAKKTYIIWDALDEDTTSTNTLEDEELNKLCLMAQNLNSCQVNSNDSPTYDILYGSYVEMHEELKKLAKKYLDKKRLILDHEKKISELQSFIDELKVENEALDLIYMLTLHVILLLN